MNFPNWIIRELCNIGLEQKRDFSIKLSIIIIIHFEPAKIQIQLWFYLLVELHPRMVIFRGGSLDFLSPNYNDLICKEHGNNTKTIMPAAC